MNSKMSQLLRTVDKEHHPLKGAELSHLLNFEEKWEVSLPEDMRQFYLHCDGASLFRPPGQYPELRFMSLSEIRRARELIYGMDTEQYGPDNQFGFLDRGDSDYLAICLHREQRSASLVVDCWHEDYQETRGSEAIFQSFEECLLAALAGDGSTLFW